jgi:osmotically-inducible protein OsmY
MKTERHSRMIALISLMIVLALAGGPFLAAGPVPAAPQDKSADAAVKARVEGKFKQQGLLLGNDIQVTVENRTVTLNGTVRTLAQKEQAGRDALSVAKGYKLANNIALADSGLSIQQIAEGIIAAIDKSASYFIFDYVGVAVTDKGVATLKGWTSYPWSVTEFVKLAQAQPGVQKVNSEIQHILIMDADRALRTQIAQLIYARPRGPSFSRMNGPVHIIVSNGIVTLGGTVDRESDIDGFERLVRFNTGAINVVNGLQVRRK